jgi:hypothetical protein
MKIGLHATGKPATAGRVDRQAHRLSQFSRPIDSEAEYLECKALLAEEMTHSSEPDSALRAEALLREIVDYEIRREQGEATHSAAGGRDWSDSTAPRRRKSDQAG